MRSSPAPVAPGVHRLLALLFGSVFSAVLLGGCTADGYAREADRAVDEILRDGTERTLGGRRETVLLPEEKREPAPPPEPVVPADPSSADPPAAAQAPAPEVEGPVARPGARDRDRDEPRPHRAQGVAVPDRLSLTGTRHAYSPLVAAALTYLFAGSSTGPESHGAAFDASISKILPTGGNLTLAGATGFSTLGEDSFSSSARIRLTQPLLRGAGHEVAYEALTQAERSLVYAIRDYELYREDFSIDVARRFYDLVQQKQSTENQRRNLEGVVFGRKQADALFQVGRTNELEVLRARRSELTSENDLIEAEESYHLALDQFRIFLGLPESRRIDVADEEPEFVPVRWDVASAVEVALANRLDLLNRQEQLEDAERGVRIAKNGLLPDLDLTLDYGRSGASDPSFAHQDLDDASYSAALSFGIPIDRVNERNAYRSSQIDLAQAQRSYAEFHDSLEVGVQSTFRELERRKKSLEIQTQLIADQERNVKIAQLRFEQGNFSNRDVVEAQQSLLDARNALINEQVDYEIARLRLLKDLGILFIDEKGMWNE
jgi:outer membrane protein TolC